MVKSRNIDVSLDPRKAYIIISDKLKKNGFQIFDVIDLSPYEKDHAAIFVSI